MRLVELAYLAQPDCGGEPLGLTSANLFTHLIIMAQAADIGDTADDPDLKR